MKARYLRTLALLSGMLVAASAVQASPALAQSKNCLSCHGMDKKLVGPSFKEIAAKYKGKGMESKLLVKVQKGGTGAWGAVPMPPNKVTDDEAKQLVRWILSL